MNMNLNSIRQMKAAHKELDSFMREQIQERKEELRGQDGKTGREDVFSMLIRANEADSEEQASKAPKLGDQELVWIHSLVASVMILTRNRSGRSPTCLCSSSPVMRQQHTPSLPYSVSSAHTQRFRKKSPHKF